MDRVADVRLHLRAATSESDYTAVNTLWPALIKLTNFLDKVRGQRATAPREALAGLGFVLSPLCASVLLSGVVAEGASHDSGVGHVPRHVARSQPSGGAGSPGCLHLPPLGLVLVLGEPVLAALKQLPSPPVWVATSFSLGLFAPLLILFARSATTRWVGALLLSIAVAAWLCQPDGGLQ